MLARVLAATVAGGVTFFILGFIVFGLILDPMVFKPNTSPETAKLMKDPPAWAFLVLGNFVAAFLLAYIFDKWATISTFVGGLIGGAVGEVGHLDLARAKRHPHRRGSKKNVGRDEAAAKQHEFSRAPDARS